MSASLFVEACVRQVVPTQAKPDRNQLAVQYLVRFRFVGDDSADLLAVYGQLASSLKERMHADRVRIGATEAALGGSLPYFGATQIMQLHFGPYTNDKGKLVQAKYRLENVVKAINKFNNREGNAVTLTLEGAAVQGVPPKEKSFVKHRWFPYVQNNLVFEWSCVVPRASRVPAAPAHSLPPSPPAAPAHSLAPSPPAAPAHSLAPSAYPAASPQRPPPRPSASPAASPQRPLSVAAVAPPPASPRGPTGSPPPPLAPPSGPSPPRCMLLPSLQVRKATQRAFH